MFQQSLNFACRRLKINLEGLNLKMCSEVIMKANNNMMFLSYLKENISVVNEDSET